MIFMNLIDMSLVLTHIYSLLQTLINYFVDEIPWYPLLKKWHTFQNTITYNYGRMCTFSPPEHSQLCSKAFLTLCLCAVCHKANKKNKSRYSSPACNCGVNTACSPMWSEVLYEEHKRYEKKKIWEHKIMM